MSDKLFVIAVGGTGMRCLESLTHLCAIGMFDNQEIDILTLDTDESNGNKKRVEDLIEQYIRIKTPSNAPIDQLGGKAGTNTFFSAKLRLTKYWTNYNTGRDNFQVLSKINASGDENQDLSSLFFDESVQVFNLAHGYRAQTHLGSHLMYHSIIESAINAKKGIAKPHEKDFIDFVERIFVAGRAARVFIFGSIFGGTGASSIPVVPDALIGAMKIYKNKPAKIEAKFGGSLLTEYFKFTSPNESQKIDKKNAVIADSMFFTLNSQAALQFYQNDPTVKEIYKSLYHVGWPVDSVDFSKGKNENETITGGEKQLNPCHVAELLCAFAAYDFFNRDDVDFSEKEAQYLFRSVEFSNNSFHFDFKDFSGEDKKFKNRLAGFYAIALFTLVQQKGAQLDNEGIIGWITRMSKMKFNKYDNLIPSSDRIEINDFFKKFLFSFDNNGNLLSGWLYQIRNSVNGKFLLPNNSFGQDKSAIEKINAGVILLDEKSQWGMGRKSQKDPSDSFQDFLDTFIDPNNFPKETQNADSSKTELIAHLFNTITKLQSVEQ